MKTILHRAIATIVLACLLKFAIDTGLWMMNQSYDFTFFLGLMLNIVSLFAAGFAIKRIYAPEFTTIKDLFTHK